MCYILCVYICVCVYSIYNIYIYIYILSRLFKLVSQLGQKGLAG